MKNTIAAESIFLRTADAPTLQGRLAAALVRAILESGARPGTRLPSSRKLAEALGLSRMTVTLVYQELVGQGYLETLPRSGVAVAATAPHRGLKVAGATAGDASLDWSQWLADHPPPRRVIRKPADWRSYRYPFIYGQPDPRLFDHYAWRDCARRALGSRDFGDLSTDRYGNDDPLLIDYICSNTLPRRGIHARPDEVLVTLGAQNALYIAVELLCRADRRAVTEEPGYPDIAETLRRSQSPTTFLPVDALGLNPETLPDDTRLVMITPSHHIPTGSTMPLGRRQALLNRATAQDFVIVEDDYDFEMSYLGPSAPALKSLDTQGRVLYIGSFSKSLFPGLRIGYLVAPAPLIAKARELRTMLLRHPPGHLQRITAYFLALGHYDAHIVRLRGAMVKRRAVLDQALAKSCLTLESAAVAGGASVWLRGPDGLDSARLAEDLKADGVLIEPGAVFFENPPEPCPLFRLGYGSIDSSDIPRGIELIDAAVKRALSRQ